MTTPTISLFSDDELRAQTARNRAAREAIARINQDGALAREVHSNLTGGATEKIYETAEKGVASIRRAGAIGRAHIAIGMAPHCQHSDDPHRDITFKVAAQQLEKLLDLYEMGRCNGSQRRIIEAVLEDTSRVKSMLDAVYDNPSIVRYWARHAKLGDRPLSETTGGMLRALVAEHFASVPGIEDLQGRMSAAR